MAPHRRDPPRSRTGRPHGIACVTRPAFRGCGSMICAIQSSPNLQNGCARPCPGINHGLSVPTEAGALQPHPDRRKTFRARSARCHARCGAQSLEAGSRCVTSQTTSQSTFLTRTATAKPLILRMRRGVRVVEGARLESVCRGNLTEGSNPSLSAKTITNFVSIGYYQRNHLVFTIAHPRLSHMATEPRA